MNSDRNALRRSLRQRRRDIPAGQTVLGYPAAPDKEAKRQWIAATQMPAALKRLRALEKRMGESSGLE